jgi:hypothetical protein
MKTNTQTEYQGSMCPNQSGLHTAIRLATNIRERVRVLIAAGYLVVESVEDGKRYQLKDFTSYCPDGN